MTDDLANRILTLPISASMTVEDARQVMRALVRVLAGVKGGSNPVGLPELTVVSRRSAR